MVGESVLAMSLYRIEISASSRRSFDGPLIKKCIWRCIYQGHLVSVDTARWKGRSESGIEGTSSDAAEGTEEESLGFPSGGGVGVMERAE